MAVAKEVCVGNKRYQVYYLNGRVIGVSMKGREAGHAIDPSSPLGQKVIAAVG